MEGDLKPIQGPLALLGSGQQADRGVYTVNLDDRDASEVDHALVHFKDLELDGHQICADNFILPKGLQDRLELAAVEVHQGKGVSLVRGLKPSRWPEDSMMKFFGLSSFVGDTRGIQDRKGNVITHITSQKQWAAVPETERHGIHTQRELAWHSDMGVDVLALQVLGKAKRGGDTYVASSWAIYNDLVRLCPQVIDTLTEPRWPIQVSGRKSKHILAPLMQYHDNRIMISLDPGRIGVHPAVQRRGLDCPIPALTPAQRQALAIVSELANKHRLRIDTQPGDMLFINNWALLHARDSYLDGDSSTRHLVRLWLRNSKLGWKIPDGLRVPWEAAFGYDNNGRITPQAAAVLGHYRRSIERKYAIVPMPEYTPPQYAGGSAAFVLEDSDEDEDDI